MDYQEFRGLLLRALYHDEEVQKKIVSLLENVSDFSQDNANTAHSFDEISRELQTLKSKFSEMETDLQQKQGELENKQKEIDRLNGVVSERQEEIEADDELLRELQDQIVDWEVVDNDNRKKIKELNQTIDDMTKQIDNLSDDFSKLQIQYDTLSEKYTALDAEFQWLEERNGELEEQLQNKTKSLEAFQTHFRLFMETDNLFREYCQLPEDIQRCFDDLICRENALTFLLSGASNENIPLLWGRIAKKVTEYSMHEVDILKRCFDLCFEYHSQINPAFERLNTQVGETYDVKWHDRTGDSQASGQVREVLLKGYQNTRTQKITKTIVRL